MNSLEHIDDIEWSWKIDQEPKTEALKCCDEPKNKHIRQPNNHEDEVEEFHVQE